MSFTVLIIAPWYPTNPITYIAQAFERIGCGVIRVGPTYNDHMGLNWGGNGVIPDLVAMRERPEWNLNELVDWTTRCYQAPDMLLVSEENYQTDIVPTKKIPSVLWSMDGWPRNYDRADLFQCTVNLTNHPIGIDQYPREEIDPRWRFLPGACAPWVHRDLKLKRDFDFCLLASSYGRRKSLCKDLERIGFKVWSGQAVTSTYVEAYNRSIATFHNARRGEVKWRFFEAAAMGCINITGWSELFAWLGYAPWHHYIPIETPDENEWPTADSLCETIRFVERNPALIKQVSGDARKRVLNQDTYYHRCKEILLALGLTHMIPSVDREIETILVNENLSIR